MRFFRGGIGPSILLWTISCAFSPAAGAEEWSRPLLPEGEQEDEPLEPPSPESDPFLEDSVARIRVLVYRKPQGVDYEFALLLVEGRIERAFVVSTARDGKRPILGTYPLEVPTVNGVPWPWRRSAKYRNSPMFWALQIEGGYFFHSSPHYGNLGSPASNGCVRASYPDAMEVFDAVVNRSDGRPSYIRLVEGLRIGSGSPVEENLFRVLRNSGWTIEDLHAALEQSILEVRSVSKGDLEYAPGVAVDAHVRPFSGVSEKDAVFPTCGGVDCWEVFRRKRAILPIPRD